MISGSNYDDAIRSFERKIKAYQCPSLKNGKCTEEVRCFFRCDVPEVNSDECPLLTLDKGECLDRQFHLGII